MKKFDVTIIGAGPAGYVGAIRAAQLGMAVALVEAAQMGGTCLNRGCIPTKAMLHSAQLFYEATHNFSSLGIVANEVGFDIHAANDYKNQVVQQLVDGIEKLVLANKIEIFHGTGQVLPGKQVKITTGEQDILIETENVLLATGAVPACLQIPGAELAEVVNSDGLLQNPQQYKEVVIVGAGVIGVEFASFYAAIGSRVTLLEYAPKALAGFGREVSQSVTMMLKKRGVEVITGAQLQQITNQNGKMICHYSHKEEIKQALGEGVLMVVGRKPNWRHGVSEELTLEEEKGFVKVNENYQTSLNWIYAAGDIIPGPQLAHLASAQAICAVEAMAGVPFTKNVSLVPSCVYTQPEIAIVGITEEIAAEQGVAIEVNKALMAANGRTVIDKADRSYIKLIAEKETGLLLGAELICPRATDLIGAFALAIANKMKAEELDHLVWAHPTFSEAVGEAGAMFGAGAIHTMPKPARRVKPE